MIQLIVVQVLDDFSSKTRFPAKYKPESLAVCQIAVKKTSEISTPDSQTNSTEDTNRCPAIRNNCRAYRGHVKYIKVSCCFLIQMQRDYITLRFSVWLNILPDSNFNVASGESSRVTYEISYTPNTSSENSSSK